MEDKKIIHPLYFHEEGISTNGNTTDSSCDFIGISGNRKFQKRLMSEEELQKEYDYYIAEKITKKMFDKGLISMDECNKLSEENLHYFSPYLAKLCC